VAIADPTNRSSALISAATEALHAVASAKTLKSSSKTTQIDRSLAHRRRVKGIEDIAVIVTQRIGVPSLSELISLTIVGSTSDT